MKNYNPEKQPYDFPKSTYLKGFKDGFTDDYEKGQNNHILLEPDPNRKENPQWRLFNRGEELE